MLAPEASVTKPVTSPDPDQLLSAREVAELLQVVVNKVYSMNIPQIRLSDRRVRYMRSDVAAFIRRCRRGS